jgi:hypothetical protein
MKANRDAACTVLALYADNLACAAVERACLASRSQTGWGRVLSQVGSETTSYGLASTYRWTTHPRLATCHQRFVVGSLEEVVSGK